MYGNYGRYQPSIGTPNMQNNQFMQPLNQVQIPPAPTYGQPMPIQTPLLGKVVDSIDVVRATDIPLDGSTSYFPLTDGSAIVTKKLQVDGTSRTIVYKPIIERKREDDLAETSNFVSLEDFLDLKSDLDDLKKELDRLKHKDEPIEVKKKEGK